MAPAYQLVQEGFSKGTMASACPVARHFSLSLCATGAFQAATLLLEFMCGFPKRNCLGL